MKKLNTIFLITLLILVGPTRALAKAIELVKPAAHRQVVLSADVAQALKKYDASFKVLNESDFSPEANNLFNDSEPQAPMLASANFNGDNIENFAVFGKAGQDYAVVLVIREKNKWLVKEVRRFSANEPTIKKNGLLNVYLSLFPAELVKTKVGGLSSRDAVQVEFYRGSTTSYYYNGSKVVEYKGAALD